AQTITDGDTLRLAGTTYRLWGIDAPELRQECPDGWPAGRLAATRLLALTQGRQVQCQAKTTDRYGRTVALCRANGEDLGAIRHYGARGHGLGVRALQPRLRPAGGEGEGRSIGRACASMRAGLGVARSATTKGAMNGRVRSS